VFGDAGQHVRSAVGVSGSPLDAPSAASSSDDKNREAFCRLQTFSVKESEVMAKPRIGHVAEAQAADQAPLREKVILER
jgi:hypothetical protein